MSSTDPNQSVASWWRRLWHFLSGPYYPPIDADLYERLWYEENGGKCHGG